jgi:hypothetical protein
MEDHGRLHIALKIDNAQHRVRLVKTAHTQRRKTGAQQEEKRAGLSA